MTTGDDQEKKAPAYFKHSGKDWRGYIERFGFRLGIILTTLGNGMSMAIHAGASFVWLSAGPLIAYAGFACFFSYVVMRFVPSSKK